MCGFLLLLLEEEKIIHMLLRGFWKVEKLYLRQTAFNRHLLAN